ncbi:MAG: hypothetical protein JSV19_04365 [Phycisphaerales bacterium]|nr:MAG: hypothetical protein JSV19_04365 [Phycisphaerales bacterium]
MKRMVTLTGLLALTVVAGIGRSGAQADERVSALGEILRQEFDLGGARSPGTRYFDIVTTLVNFGADGKRGDTETFRAKLKCVSRGDAARAAEQYTCGRFVYVRPDGTQVTIPTLEGWTYPFKKTETGYDEKGQVLGIDHSKFQQLTDSNGDCLGPDKSYMIYNTFIDFHAFCDAFAAPVAEGKGIQHLTRIGQRIVHAAAHTTPPTNLGGNIKDGSYFKNGEITLSLKGLSIIDDAPCAVVEFDSGASSFQMLMEPMPNMEVKTIGASHYFGDIHVDLASRWPRKVDMRELIISETKVPIPGNPKPMTVNSVQERQTAIRAVTKAAYEKL